MHERRQREREKECASAPCIDSLIWLHIFAIQMNHMKRKAAEKTEKKTGKIIVNTMYMKTNEIISKCIRVDLTSICLCVGVGLYAIAMVCKMEYFAYSLLCWSKQAITRHGTKVCLSSAFFTSYGNAQLRLSPSAKYKMWNKKKKRTKWERKECAFHLLLLLS